MQSWPLERKIRVSQLRIMEWYEHFKGNVVVSFSGGVDSTVLLDLTRRIYPDMQAVFVNTTNEFPEIIQFVRSNNKVEELHPKANYKQVVEKYGYPVISKEQSNYIHRIQSNPLCKKAYEDGVHLKSREWMRENFSSIPFSFFKCMFGLNHKNEKRFLEQGIIYDSKYRISNQWQYLISAPFAINDRCCYHLKKAPIHKYQKEHGCKMIIGTLAEESILRRQVWLKQGCNAFQAKDQKSTPLSFWTEQDIILYLKITGIPYASIYGDIINTESGKLAFSGYQRSGCMGCLYGCHLEQYPNRLQRLKSTHYKVYQYLFDKLNYKMVCDYIGIPY